ncbi:MAG: sigma-54-dependent Fis family transcriptional regulator [Desulfobacter sp.]|nr:MAG: sigma-54-dependent Fis family transcriptional regulator [Desulfobacter sp.]
MDAHNTNEDFLFFQEAVSHISGSLDLSESMVRVFDFLKDHFPIDGISLHQYSRQLKAIKLLFLVTKDSFNYVETALPLSDENARYMEMHEQNPDPIVISDELTNTVSDDHRRAISHLLPYKPSSYLVGIMKSGEKTVGHLCFIGKGKLSYTRTQIRKMKLLLGPFNLAMSNMLKFRRVMAFQEKLYREKSHLEKELHQLKAPPIIGARSGLRKTMDVVHQLEGKETPVLILGETGTGKELIADAVQRISPRAAAPFIKVNCGAIPDTLIDSELFGYEKGAFTGAAKSHAGKFEQAHGGTLFLDEIGELPLQAQVRFLRVLQNGKVERLGGKSSIPVDVRIIAATNRDLKAMIREGSFREDLYYRLYVFPVYLPPLRERTRDIPALVRHFLDRACARLNISPRPVIGLDTVNRIKAYPWPGNVRELENFVERALILFPDGALHLESLLPIEPSAPAPAARNHRELTNLIDQRIRRALDGRPTGPSAPEAPTAPVQPLEKTIKESICAALSASRGKVHGENGAAALLGLNPSTLRNKMRKLNIEAGTFKG